jgi:hypothetical protein
VGFGSFFHDFRPLLSVYIGEVKLLICRFKSLSVPTLKVHGTPPVGLWGISPPFKEEKVNPTDPKPLCAVGDACVGEYWQTFSKLSPKGRLVKQPIRMSLKGPLTDDEYHSSNLCHNYNYALSELRSHSEQIAVSK